MQKKYANILVTILLFINFNVSAITKHALIIAIGNYPAAGGWPQLSSVQDAKYIKTILRKNDFDESHIKTILDEESTIKGISNAFEQLIKDVNAGDVVVIHFSSHGEQVKAADPNKLGGLDQCVVTYNAVLPKLSTDFNKDQAEYLRGQTIGNYLLALRNKLGKKGDVVVFMDYCHSGAGTRGAGKKRGGQEPFLPPGDVLKQDAKPKNSDMYDNGTKSRGSDENLATFVAISATRPEEFDLETDDNGVGIGSLTYAISKSFERLDPTTTYRSLFASIQSIMNDKVPAQHPLIEGNGLDRALFGGNFVPQKAYIEIDVLGEKNQLVLKDGLLAGLDTGAKVLLYKAGTTEPAKATAIAAGTVIAANNFSSTVQLDKASGLNLPADGWVFISEPVYHIKPIGIKIISDKTNKNKGIATGFTEADVAIINNSLTDLPLVSVNAEPELLLVKGAKEDSILIACDGSLFATIPDIKNNIAKLKSRVEDYAKYKFIKNIDLRDADAQVEIILLPCINGKAELSRVKDKLVGGIYEYHNRDTLMLWVKNTGNADVYVNILDLQPDGKINPILPNKNLKIHPIDLKIKKGEEHIFQTYPIIISPPLGNEVFKVFVSKEEIDMEGLATKGEARARGGSGNARGNLSIMEKLVKKSERIASRGAEVFNSETADGTTYNIVFRIVP